MDEKDLDELREKRREELMEKQGSSEAEEQKKAKAEAQKKAALRKILTPEARQRLSNLRTARPEFAESIEQQLVLLASRGRVQGKIDDDKLKAMLREAQSGKRDINIRRK